jgi:hypothetical protein
MISERPLRAIFFGALLPVAALALAATVLRAAVGAEDLVRSAELLVLASAATLAGCALVLARAAAAAPTVNAALAAAALTGLTTLALAAATGALSGSALALAAGTFVLVGAFGLGLALAAAALRDRLAAATLLSTIGALAAAAAVWLGPVAERLAPTGALVSFLVAVSPLTYLAVLADHDYLRATWFYEHSALGSLRYDYPSVLSLSLVYALPFAATAALRLPVFSQSRLAKELFR